MSASAPPSRAGGHLSAPPPPPRSLHRTPSPAAAAAASASTRRSGPPPGSAAASSSSAPPPPHLQQHQHRRQQQPQQRSHHPTSGHSSRGDSPTLGSSDSRLPPQATHQPRPQLSPRQYSNSTARSSSWRARSQASRTAPTAALPPLPSAPPIADAGARRSPSEQQQQQLSASPESTLSPNSFLDLFPSPDVHPRDTSPSTSAALVAAALALRKAQAQETPSRAGAPSSQDRPMLYSEQLPMQAPLGRPPDLAPGQRKRLPIVPLPVAAVAPPLAVTSVPTSSPMDRRTALPSDPSSAAGPSLHDHVAAGLSYTLAAAQLVTPEPTRVEPMLSQEALNVLHSTPMPVLLARALAKINDLELALEYYRDTSVRASADAVFWESQYQRLVRDFLKLEAESIGSARREPPSWLAHAAPAPQSWQPRRSSAMAHAPLPPRRESKWGTAAEASQQHRAARTDSHPRGWRDGKMAPFSDGPSDVATGLHTQPLAPLHRRGAWRRGSAETARQHQRSSSEGYDAVGPSSVPAAVRLAHLAARRPSSSSTPRRRSETTPLVQEPVAPPREVPSRRRSPALEWMRSSSVSECGESVPHEDEELPVSSDDQVYHEVHSGSMPLSAPATEAWRAAAPAARGPSDVPVDETSDHLSSPGAQRSSGDCITSIDGLERLAVSGSVMTASLGTRHVPPETSRTRASHVPTTAGPQYLLQSRRPFSFTPNASPTHALRSLGSPFVHHDSPLSAATHGPLTPLDGVSPFISPRTSVDTPSLPADPFAWRPLSGLALSFGEAHDVHAHPLQSYWSESTCPSTEESDDSGALEAWRRGCVAEPSSASSSVRHPSSSPSAASFDYVRDAPGTLQHNPRSSKGGADALFFGSSPSPKQRPASLPQHHVPREAVHES